jgi:lupus La protein
MRKHLNLGDIKPDEVKEETVKAVAEVLKNAATLKLSEDGQFLALLTHSFLFCAIQLYLVL